ncbi:MAG: ergothioneine biosynthesis protein EgtB [Burkholderiales bacterium]|nr:ergothioneine biosynthesis protein EgtB [Burkholderiales bacterium]
MGRIADVGAPVAGHAGPKSREALAAALADARDYTRRCYAHLAGGDPVFPCIAIVNPARWELGHIGWFQEFWCRRWRPDDRAGARTPARIANADALWNSSRVPHDSRWALPLPDWAGIDRYLGETYADTMTSLATSGDGERYPYELSLYHEDMHGEALLMTLQTLGYAPPAGFPPPPGVGRAAPVRDIAFVGGALGMGSTPDDERERFVFDNEKLRHRVDVGAFAIASRTVTEDEFAAFVDDGGYRRSDLWSEDGRRWLAVAGRTVPAYWRPCGSGYEVRWFDRWRPLSPGTAIQHVNAYEAEAWCAWAGRRLPTEAEWEFAATRAGSAVGARLDAREAGPGAAEAGAGAPAHLLGNVWEWTSTPFGPYPGFAPDRYADYSAPWFGDHRVIRGGSWATRSRLVHARFRNYYQPHRHDVFAGFRTCAVG